MTPTRAVRSRPAGPLALAGGLALALAVALYAIGRTHTPSYTMGLFGRHGVAVYRLKAQLVGMSTSLGPAVMVRLGPTSGRTWMSPDPVDYAV
jgi:hypothetical protein